MLVLLASDSLFGCSFGLFVTLRLFVGVGGLLPLCLPTTTFPQLCPNLPLPALPCLTLPLCPRLPPPLAALPCPAAYAALPCRGRIYRWWLRVNASAPYLCRRLVPLAAPLPAGW